MKTQRTHGGDQTGKNIALPKLVVARGSFHLRKHDAEGSTHDAIPFLLVMHRPWHGTGSVPEGR